MIVLLALVQFAVIVDFIMVMPLGPDFALVLGIAHDDLGIVSFSYTLAAAASGLVSAVFLDRLDRRSALVIAVIGLGAATLTAAFAASAVHLYLARIMAGCFGGPAAALVFALVADHVPPERRGRALAKVMIAFTLASVLGVPVGLELSRLGGWRLPFIVVGALALTIAVLIRWRVPAQRGHLENVATGTRLAHLRLVFLHRDHMIAYALVLLTLGSSFLIIPHLATFAQFNLGFPREHLGWLYFVGGVVSFVSMQLAGRTADKHGPLSVFVLGSVLVITVLCGVTPQAGWPALALIPGFMLANSLRVVAINTLTSQVPNAAERAGFMALDSVAHHAAIALAAFASTKMLDTTQTGSLKGMTSLAVLAAMLIVASLPVATWLYRRVAIRASKPTRATVSV